jgi:hypothetical protein
MKASSFEMIKTDISRAYSGDCSKLLKGAKLG